MPAPGHRPVTIAVAVISYARADQLARLLANLQQQRPADPSVWQARIVVVDNDARGSAEPTVRSATGHWRVDYLVEPEPGIPFAREASVRACPSDDAVVFVDDDEVTPAGWLDRLVTSWLASGHDAVTGPVRGLLPATAPRWARHSDVYSSVGRHRTGDLLDRAYTNNTLVSRAVLDSVSPAFDPAFRFTGSSDLNFFQRVHRAGFTIVWDDEAVVEEFVPEQRVELGWLVRRAFRSGAGDAVSRRLLRPGARGVAEAGVMGLGRIANGAVLVALGVGSPERRIKGLRRVVSGVGTLSGIVGLNYEEYRR